MNLSRIIERHAQFSPRQVALHFEGRDLSYPQLWQHIERASVTLCRAGVQPGDRVAWLGQNDPAMLVLLFALSRIGAILLPLNYRLADVEHTAILAHAGARMLVAHDNHLASARAQATALSLELVPAAELIADRPGTHVPTRALVSAGSDRAPVLLVYTSGTTGLPKGALHTQAGLLWNCINASHAQDLTVGDHVLTVLPLFHVGGLCIQTLPALHAGATVTLHPRFDAGHWLSDVQLRRPDLSVMVPATLRAVQEHPQFDSTDLSSLRLVVAGSSVVPIPLIEAYHRRGVVIGQVYGASETGPVSIYLRRDDALQVPGSAGKAGLHVQVRLVDRSDADVGAGEVGEIWIRAPNMMQAYWNDPDNPAFQDHWFRSGDLARQDTDGFYWVVGRSRDMIISGGENIYPAEIENLLSAWPEIEDVAVIGQPDPRWGEVVVAIVVCKAGTTLDEAQVLGRLDGCIARFKLPRRVLFRDDLPKTALGKVQKRELQVWAGSR